MFPEYLLCFDGKGVILWEERNNLLGVCGLWQTGSLTQHLNREGSWQSSLSPIGLNQGACMHAKSLQLCMTLCDPMDCAPPSSFVHGILQANYWSVLPCPPPGDLPNLGIKPSSLTSPALAGRFFTTSTTWEAPQPRNAQQNTQSVPSSETSNRSGLGRCSVRKLSRSFHVMKI